MDACVRACVRLEVTCVGAGRICASAQEERELLACLSNHDWATVPANLKWRALAWLWYVCSSTTSISSSSGCGMYASSSSPLPALPIYLLSQPRVAITSLAHQKNPNRYSLHILSFALESGTLVHLDEIEISIAPFQRFLYSRSSNPTPAAVAEITSPDVARVRQRRGGRVRGHARSAASASRCDDFKGRKESSDGV